MDGKDQPTSAPLYRKWRVYQQISSALSKILIKTKFIATRTEKVLNSWQLLSDSIRSIITPNNWTWTYKHHRAEALHFACLFDLFVYIFLSLYFNWLKYWNSATTTTASAANTRWQYFFVHKIRSRDAKLVKHRLVCCIKLCNGVHTVNCNFLWVLMHLPMIGANARFHLNYNIAPSCTFHAPQAYMHIHQENKLFPPIAHAECTSAHVTMYIYLGDDSDTKASTEINESAFLLSGLNGKKCLADAFLCVFFHWTVGVRGRQYVCVNFISVGVEMAWFLV